MQSVIHDDRCKDAWIAAAWKQEWEASGSSRDSRVHRHVSDPGEGVKGEDLSRKQWMTLNRLRTGVGRYRSSMKKWGRRTVQHVSVASQNRQLITSSTAAHYTDHHPRLASLKLNH